VSGTTSKPRGVALPVAGDDYTDVTSPPAPWDGRDEDDASGDPDGTKQTGVSIQIGAPVPTPTHRHASAPAREDYDLEPGTALGEYRIEGKIGQGGMGVVFSAVHPLIGKRAAIKILKKELCADPHTLERFVDEARVVNEIGHPNIVDIFAFGEMPDGRSYFVMEWLKGETLRARIARGKLAPAEVGQIVRPLARALEAAHEKGVIHRDLKPDNVFLVDVRGEVATVKLLDFGIAKLARNDHRVEKTATGAIVGTPQYIAPEQAKGYSIDHRADIYALGGIIYELLTGRPPFVADNAMEMVAKHLMETPLPPSELAPEVPPDLDDLVLRMLAKLPAGRPSLAEVCEVIERVKVRASTKAQYDATVAAPRAPTPAPIPMTPLPNDGSAPVARISFEDSAPVGAISRPAYDAVVSQAQPSSIAPRRLPLWIAIVGVPLAGIAAFLIVSATGGTSSAPAPEPSASTTPSPSTPTPTPPTLPSITEASPPVVADVTPPTPAKVTSPTPAKVTTQPPVKVPAPAHAPARAQLRLVVTGAKAPEIYIDSKRSTAEVKLRPGPHVVEIRARGMQTQKLRVDVAPTGVTTQRIALLPTMTKVEPPKKVDPPKVDPPKITPPKVTPPKVTPKNDGTELLSPGALNPSPSRR